MTNLNELQATAKSVNKLSARISDQVTFLEAFFAKLNIGVETWVELPRNGFKLGYCPKTSGWHICLDTPEAGVLLFTESKRVLRLEAVPYMSKLIDALLEKAKKTESSLVEAVTMLDSVLKKLEV